MSSPTRPYAIAEWPNLTTDTIDWSRWNEDDQYLALQMPVPASADALDAAWSQHLTETLSMHLFGQRSEISFGWISYEVNARIFSGSSEYRARGFLELQSQGDGRSLVRLWTSSPGPSGSNHRGYSNFDLVSLNDFLNDCDRQTASGSLDSTALARLSEQVADSTIAMHVRKKAEVARLKEELYRWLRRLGESEIIRFDVTAPPHQQDWPIFRTVATTVAIAGSALWLFAEPSWEPALALAALISAVVLTFRFKNKWIARALDVGSALALIAGALVLVSALKPEWYQNTLAWLNSLRQTP